MCQLPGGTGDEGPWYLFGVVSWGDLPCAQRHEPAVYTRITEYRKWITKATGGIYIYTYIYTNIFNNNNNNNSLFIKVT